MPVINDVVRVAMGTARGANRRAEVRHGVLKATHLTALLIGNRRHGDGPKLRCQLSDAKTRQQHRPGHDLGPGARIERGDHHHDAGEQRQESELDNPARGRVREDLRYAGGGQQQRDREWQQPNAGVDRRQPERDGQEQRNCEEQPSLR